MKNLGYTQTCVTTCFQYTQLHMSVCRFGAGQSSNKTKFYNFVLVKIANSVLQYITTQMIVYILYQRAQTHIHARADARIHTHAYTHTQTHTRTLSSRKAKHLLMPVDFKLSFSSGYQLGAHLSRESRDNGGSSLSRVLHLLEELATRQTHYSCQLAYYRR